MGQMARLGALLIGLASGALNQNCAAGSYVRARNPLASYARTSTPMGGGSTSMFEEAKEESAAGDAHEALVETAGQKVLTVTFNQGRNSVSIGAHTATDTYGKPCVLADAPATNLRGATSAAAPPPSGAPRIRERAEQSERERGLQVAIYVAVPMLFITLAVCVMCFRNSREQVRDLRVRAAAYPYAVEVSPPELLSPAPRAIAKRSSEASAASLTPRSIGAASTDLPDGASVQAVSVSITPRSGRSLTPPPVGPRSGARSLTPPRGSVARDYTPPRGSAARANTPPRQPAQPRHSRGSRSLTPRSSDLPPRGRDVAPRSSRTRSLTPLGAGRRTVLRQTHALPLPGALP